MKKYLKGIFMMLLCTVTAAVPAGSMGAVYAGDTSQSYSFDLMVNGSSSACTVKAGEKVDVTVTLTRTDSGAADTFTMYAVQYDLMADTRYFSVESSEISGGGTKGVQTFVTDMSKNGSWSGYKKITAAAVNASGSQWKNGCVVLKCTLTALRSGETELKPYNSIVSVSTGMDNYSTKAESAKVTITSPDEEGGNEPGTPDEGKDDAGKDNNGSDGKSDSGSTDNTGGTGNTGNSGNNSNSGSTGGSGSSNTSNTGGSSDGSGADQTSGSDAFSKFTDMSQHWSRTYVQYAVNKGYFSGMTETQFAPDKTMTRAMLVTVLWRMENEPAYNGDSAFSDVKAGAWYGQAVQWAADKGIVSGAGNGRFMPESPLTREQLIQIIRNYASYKGASVTASSSLDGFADASSVSAWAKDAFAWGISSGMISGTGNNALSPKGGATRAQVAKILSEFDKNILKTA